MRQVASAGSRDLLCKREGSDENEGMKAPMYVRALSPAEQAGIAAGLRSSDAFTLRRSQILLASSREQRPVEIARNLGCATQTVRNRFGDRCDRKGSRWRPFPSGER
jgi:hypothetical protein